MDQKLGELRLFRHAASMELEERPILSALGVDLVTAYQIYSGEHVQRLRTAAQWGE
jgi:hypothetical protein